MIFVSSLHLMCFTTSNILILWCLLGVLLLLFLAPICYVCHLSFVLVCSLACITFVFRVVHLQWGLFFWWSSMCSVLRTVLLDRFCIASAWELSYVLIKKSVFFVVIYTYASFSLEMEVIN